MIQYIVPSVSNGLKLERHCPHCGRFGGNIHSSIIYRCVSDTRVNSIPQRRMKCPFCKTTWTLRVEGIGDGKQRTDRLIAISLCLYMFGLSYRNVEKFLKMLDCRGSKSSIERDVADAGGKAKELHKSAPRMRVRILGVDGTGAKMAGTKAGLLFFADVERNRLIGVEPINETDTEKVRKHVQKVFAMLGAEQLRTDELSVYENIVPEGSHKICLAHWLKSKCRRTWQLYQELISEGMKFEAEEMLKLIEILKSEPRSEKIPESLEKLVRRYINCHKGILFKVNQLLQHIERTWGMISYEGGDRTNNATERIIGLDYKIRAKTMRGFKSWKKAIGHVYLSEFLRGKDSVCDLRRVI